MKTLKQKAEEFVNQDVGKINVPMIDKELKNVERLCFLAGAKAVIEDLGDVEEVLGYYSEPDSIIITHPQQPTFIEYDKGKMAKDLLEKLKTLREEVG